VQIAHRSAASYRSERRALRPVRDWDAEAAEAALGPVPEEPEPGFATYVYV